MVRVFIFACFGLGLVACAQTAMPELLAEGPEACRPDVLGTSRILVLEGDGRGWGRAQHEALPLQAGEVVLTFDDGPRPESTPTVLASLKAECVRATFFMVGGNIDAHPDLARAVLAAGHSVGLHAYVHRPQSELVESEQQADYDHVFDAARRAMGRDASAVYRFPNLVETPFLLARAKAQGVDIMSIDLAIDDWNPEQSPDVLEARLLQRLTVAKSGIILMHDAQDQTATALPRLLKALKTRGYRVVHLEWRHHT